MLKGRLEWLWIAGVVVSTAIGMTALVDHDRLTVVAYVGFGACVVLVALGGCLPSARRSGRKRWLALWAAGAATLVVFSITAPAGTSSCDQATDCDTSFALGLPFLVAIGWLVAVPLIAAGGLLSSAIRGTGERA